MITITALLRAKPGHGDDMLAALRRAADHVAAEEPGTRGFHVCRDLNDPLAFTTYERFVDHAAMEHHNATTAVRFGEEAGDWIEGDVTLLTGEEMVAVSK